MAYIVIAYIVMAYIVMAYGFGLYSHGLYSDGPYSHGLYNYGLYGCGLSRSSICVNPLTYTVATERTHESTDERKHGMHGMRPVLCCVARHHAHLADVAIVAC